MPSTATTSRILIIFAHSMPQASRANRALIQAARRLPNVVVQDLYECYPDFHIDVAREQALLAAADLVVLQHPLQWYSMPALLKEWVDVVLEAGWAYGEGGTALLGKDFLLAVTTGSMADAYHEAGLHQWPFAAFLPAYRQTAQLCGMRWCEPFILHGARQITDEEVEAHVAHYVERLAHYSDDPGAGTASAIAIVAASGDDGDSPDAPR
jgi:putative NADPH-quinone reductase